MGIMKIINLVFLTFCMGFASYTFIFGGIFMAGGFPSGVSGVSKISSATSSKNMKVKLLMSQLESLAEHINRLTEERKQLKAKGRLTPLEQERILKENQLLWAEAKRLEREVKQLVKDKKAMPLSKLIQMEKDVAHILVQCDKNQQSIESIMNHVSQDQRMPASQQETKE